METTSCMQEVVASAHQYRSSQTDENLVHLQRQLDVLISVSQQVAPLDFFDPRQLLPTECLACLHDILNDWHTRPSLVHKALILLNNLTNSADVRDSLHDAFQMTSCLANCLHSQVSSPADPVLTLCLKLLQTITYNRRISCDETYAADLVKFLMKHVQNKESEITALCLGLLCNLCRHNASVQAHIKSQEKTKPFFKRLIGFLTHHNQTIVIFALSILTCLCLHEELGEKLFNPQNVNQTFQLMFNVLVKGDSVMSQRYTADLFIDLVCHIKIQHSLARYDHLQPCLVQILALLDGNDTQVVAKIFELLLAFSSVSAIHSKLCEVLFTMALSPPGSSPSKPTPFASAVRWASEPTRDSTPLLALNWLKHVYKEVLNDGKASRPPACTDQLLPMLMAILAPGSQTKDPTPQHQPYAARLKYQRVDKALRLVLVMCVDGGLKAKFGRTIQPSTCVQLLDYQLGNNRVSVSAGACQQQQQQLDDWSEAGADVVLHTMELMLAMIDHAPDMQTCFCQYIQDSRIVPFLVRGITSGCRDRVRSALKLVSMGATLDKFPSVVLGDSIAACNAMRVSPSVWPAPTSPSHPSSDLRAAENKENMRAFGTSMSLLENTRLPTAANNDLEASVQSLIKKMQSSFELKDLRASEIISVYEHQLQSLQTKENHLQDLLEAKAMALSQADRLIAQYRCRRAQSEAEGSQLRALLQQSEHRGEELHEQMLETTSKRDRMNADIEQLLQENNRLEVIADEHTELVQSYTEQTQKLENSKRTLVALQQEHQTVSEMYEMLRRHNDSLKQQHEVASKQLVELEDERKHTAKQLKEKEAKVQDLTRGLSKSEEQCTKAGKERDQLEKAIDKLRDELGRTEEAKKKLTHQVSSLEVVCRQHESSLQEKETHLAHTKTELDKHAQIAALIHNLSSGQSVNNDKVSAFKS